MGVVKHLGLSNAHGDVSSFASIKLGFRFRDSVETCNVSATTTAATVQTTGEVSKGHQQGYSEDWKHGNIASSPAVKASCSSLSSLAIPSEGNNNNIIYTNNNKTYQSSTIPFNSSPKWPSVQTESNTSLFTVPLKKGTMPQDGMKIVLSVEMREERTAVDSIVPIGKGGGDGSLLGAGEIDLTGLVLRGLVIDQDRERSSSCRNEKDGQPNDFVDVFDEWINLANPHSSSPSDANRESNQSHNGDQHFRCGKVRLIISYEPCGMKPEKGDIIAFEAFARRPALSSRCPTIVPPLHPLQIKDMKGEYILAWYDMVSAGNSSPTTQEQQQQQLYNDDVIAGVSPSMNSHIYNGIRAREGRNVKRGTVRIHRNTIFVIERTNLLDTAVDLSLKPADMIMSTTMGRNVSQAAQPYVEAAGDLLAPVLLSSRLLLEASKVGGGALAVGVKSAVVSVVESSDPEKRRKAKRSSFCDD